MWLVDMVLGRIRVRLKHVTSLLGRGRACPGHPDYHARPLPTLPCLRACLRGRVGRGRGAGTSPAMTLMYDSRTRR